MSRFNAKLITLCAVVLVIGALAYLSSNRASKSGSARIGTVKIGDVDQRVTIAGNIIPERRTIILAPFEGYIKELFVKVGDKVKTGDPIVIVSPSLSSDERVFPVRAPYAGLVVQVPKFEGEFVKTDAAQFIARIDDISKRYVLANVPEIEALKLKIGQEAEIRATAVLGRIYKGILRNISLSAVEKDRWSNVQNVEFPIQIEVIDADEDLRSGMSVLVDIVASSKKDVLVLENEFVAEDDGKAFVTLLDGTKRTVEVGTRNEQFAEILSGVREGEEVLQIDFLSLVDKKD